MNSLLFVILIIFIIILIILSKNIFTQNAQSVSPIDLNVSEDEIYEHVKNLIDNKQYDAAFKMAKKYLSQVPHHYRLRFLLAKSLYEFFSNYNEAIHHLNLVIKNDRRNEEAYLILGFSYQALSQYAKAIAAFKKVLSINYENEDAILSLGNLYEYTKQKKSALRMYLNYIKYSNNRDEIFNVLHTICNIYMDIKNWEELSEYALKILNIDENDYQGLEFLKIAYTNLHLSEKACEVIKKQIELSPDDFSLYKELINLYFEIKDYDAVLEACEESMTLENVDTAYIKNIQAKTYINTGKIDNCFDIVKEALALNPKDVQLKQTLACAYLNINEFQTAINLYNELIDEVDPSDIPYIKHTISDCYCCWASYLIDNDNLNEAFEKFSQALTYNDKNPEIYYNLGLIGFKIKNYFDAQKQFRRAIELAPNVAKYYMTLGDLQIEIENIYDAKQSYIDAISMEPENAQAQATLGILYSKLKDVENAIKHLTIAEKLNPNDCEVKYNLGLINEINGNINLAVEKYNEVLRLNPNHEEAKNSLHLINEFNESE